MPTRNPRDPLLAVIGPSGAGKSTAVQALADAGVVDVNPSWTTRPPRPGEVERCVEHRFVTEAEFDALERAGFFVESVRMFGLAHRYGLPPVRRAAAGAVPLVMLRVPHLGLLRRLHDLPLVYQVEDSRERVAARLLRRDGELGTRLRDYEAEVALGRAEADRVFVNDRDAEALVTAIRQAIVADFLPRLAGAGVRS
jgi:guanylate kinase